MENLPVTVKYSLTEDEMNLTADAVLGNRGKNRIAIIRTVVLMVLAVVFAQQYIFPSVSDPNYIMGATLIALCGIMIFLSWITPGRERIKFLRHLQRQNGFTITICEDSLLISEDNQEKRVLFSEAESKQSGDIYILYSSDGGILPIPIRIEEEYGADNLKYLKEKIKSR